MNWLRYIIKGILIGFFGLSAVLNFYEAGKYAQGFEENRKGNRWMRLDLAVAFIDLLFILAIIYLSEA